MPEIERLFDSTMRPRSPLAAKLGNTFAQWLIAELHERGVTTIGFGPVNPKWRLATFPEGKAMLQRELTEDLLFRLLARVFFYGKKRTLADCSLCQITAQAAFTYGLVGGPA